ncbi:hypothetical protein EV363DRAFT_1178044, partial [Boletus edulis]
YAPFVDRSEWELAGWLVKNVNQRATDGLLKLPVVSSIRSTVQRMHLLIVHVRGDAEGPGEANDGEDHQADELEDGGEELELWLRDPVACVRELIGNAAFRSEMAYAPEKVYTDPNAKARRYDEAWTGKRWWETQVCPCEIPRISDTN